MFSSFLPQSRTLAPTSVGTFTRLLIPLMLLVLTGYVILSSWPPPSPQLDLSGEKYQYIPSSYDWANFKHFNPRKRSEMTPLPDGPLESFPRLQYDFENHPWSDRLSDEVLKERRDAVRNAFIRGWRSYKEKAWGADELLPLSGGSEMTFYRWGATLVDSLDTLWMMDLLRDFHDGVAFVAQLDLMGPDADEINVFEVTIRFLGGLLAAYDLSGERVLLERARELGDLLYVGFDTPNRLPIGFIKFDEARAGELVAYTKHSSAALGTLSMEFTRLSQLTGDNKYYDAINIITEFLRRLQKTGTDMPGMWPAFIDSQNERINDNRYTLGASADSLYEYLLKEHMLLGGREPKYRDMFLASMEAAKTHLLAKPMLPDDSPDILFVGQWRSKAVDGKHLTPTQAHLGCFAGGMYGMGGKLFNKSEYFKIGARISKGCAWAYNVTGTGVMPELFHYLPCNSIDAPCPWDQELWEKDAYNTSLPLGMARVEDSMYKLRPEAVESLFLMYRMTGDPAYQEMAWNMFKSMIRATETEFAYASIKDVMTTGPTIKEDKLESFWFAETLKYLYLIFSPPDLISLDEYVFNTEAHPLKRPSAVTIVG